MAKEALLKIVSAEKEAGELIQRARDESRKILDSAEKKSKKLLEDSYIKAKIEVDQMKKEANDSMKEELDRINQTSIDRCKAIGNIEQDKFDEAKRFLVERIVG